MKYLVNTKSSIKYSLKADHFQITDGIVHFFDSDGYPVWVIKDWISFECNHESEKKNMSPDEFYDSLREDPNNKEII